MSVTTLSDLAECLVDKSSLLRVSIDSIRRVNTSTYTALSTPTVSLSGYSSVNVMYVYI